MSYIEYIDYIDGHDCLVRIERLAAPGEEYFCQHLDRVYVIVDDDPFIPASHRARIEEISEIMKSF
jgi:hypothetical protein